MGFTLNLRMQESLRISDVTIACRLSRDSAQPIKMQVSNFGHSQAFINLD